MAKFHVSIAAVLQLCLLAVSALAADAPPPEAFRVLPPVMAGKPEITPYLRYQTEMAWHEDDLRRAAWEGIRTEEDLLHTQRELRKRLLEMIGGLPTEKTPLNARTTGRIQMQGFHIEKLIFESLPGIYVAAMVYAPDAAGKHPAVLVPSGHSTNGKAYYQALCQRLVQHGYVVISWDAFGQGERSQFWDEKNHKSRYNLICAEHAILGNLAYLAGTNLARWEIWDGIRAVDYLLTRPDVDPERINITGTSGGGFQTTLIAALDPRIKVVAPSCYITALPMRVYNRIFKDPDSDPEQDLDGMISNGLDHPGLLLLMYPRPVWVSAAVLDFFPIDGTIQTVHEVKGIYEKFGHADRIGMHEGYHGHQFSDENQEAAINFLDHFNGLPRRGLPEVKQLDDQTLQCTRAGQVMIEYPNARSLMDVIHDYFEEHKDGPAITLKQIYYSKLYPGINSWHVAEYQGAIPEHHEILWEPIGTTTSGDVRIDRYLLHHSRYLAMPLLHVHKSSSDHHRMLLWLGENGKVSASDWPNVMKYLDAGYDIVSVDPRGLGETRMPYKAASPDDPTLSQIDFDRAYVSPISGVLADYVYNSVLTGRPYLLQMIEDVEIAARFAEQKMNHTSEFSVIGTGDAFTLSSAVAETLPNIKLLPQPDAHVVKWSDLVEKKEELWPIQYLLPGGAYIH